MKKKWLLHHLKVIKKNKFQFLLKEIQDIIKENDIKGVVIGNPINMDGSFGKSSQSSYRFCKEFIKKYYNSYRFMG